MTEEKYGIIILFFDKPNMDFIEKEDLRRKIDHNKFFAFLREKGKELHIRFYWQSNKDESPYRQHLKALRLNLQSQGIRFVSIETDKDVDITIINDMTTVLFDVDDSSRRPEKIILCSGDKDFSVALGVAGRRFGVSITVISGRNHCAEVLKDVSDEIIFVEDMVSDNEELLLGSSNSIE